MQNNFIMVGFRNDVIRCTYDELVEKLGEPTSYGTADNKVQREWEISEDDLYFTIYDWKEYDIDVTDGRIVEWHIAYNNNIHNRENIVKWLNERNIEVIKLTI